MNSPRQGRDPIDGYLRQSLKDWASRTHPPSDGRARLLWEAATVRPEPQTNRLAFLRNLFTVEKYGQDGMDPTEMLLHQAKVHTFQFLFIGFH